MTPLDRMVKAAFPGKGETVDAKKALRAALLALADAPLTPTMFTTAYLDSHYEIFRGMLRQIANGGSHV